MDEKSGAITFGRFANRKEHALRDGRQSLCPPNQLDFLASNRCVPWKESQGERRRDGEREEIYWHILMMSLCDSAFHTSRIFPPFFSSDTHLRPKCVKTRKKREKEKCKLEICFAVYTLQEGLSSAALRWGGDDRRRPARRGGRKDEPSARWPLLFCYKDLRQHWVRGHSNKI